MAISYEVFHNVKTCTHGSQALFGIVSITVSRQRPPIIASADDNIFIPVAEAGVGSLTGSITFVDPAMASTAYARTQASTLSFIEEGLNDAADDTVEIKRTRFTGGDNTATHSAASSATVAFVASSADGTTDPYSRT